MNLLQSMRFTRGGRVVPFVLILMVWLALLSDGAQAQYLYTTETNTVTITSYTGPEKTVAIPSTIDGMPVVNIGTWAFATNTDLVNIQIPNSVTNIGYGAFEQCKALTNVTIGNSVATIEVLAFGQCYSLRTVNIPNSVRNIGDLAFGSSGLVNFSGGNGVTNIGDSAFQLCEALTNVNLGTSLITIGWRAFGQCWTLRKVIIPDSVKEIGYDAFGNCTNLQSLTIGQGVRIIRQDAFYQCYQLTNVTLPDSLLSIPPRLFYWCERLTNVVIGRSVTNIGGSAFTSTALRSVTIPASVLAIEHGAFSECISLTEVFCKGDAPVVSYDAFRDYRKPTVYYLAGTKGWTSRFGGCITALWRMPMVGTDFRVLGNNSFGFTVSGISNGVVVVESCVDLSNPIWLPVQTNIMTGGSWYFSDPTWTESARRFYRVGVDLE